MILLSSLLSAALAAPVFIIEDGAPEIEDMVLSLEAHGHTVSVSSDFGFLEYEFTGDEVDLQDMTRCSGWTARPLHRSA